MYKLKKNLWIKSKKLVLRSKLWAIPWHFLFLFFSLQFSEILIFSNVFVLVVFSFLVDNTPIRVFKNAESVGVPFPKNQPMRIYSSLWNADDWATRGGLVKTDWTKAPFTAYYRNFNARPSSNSKYSGGAWQNQELDANSRRRLRWVQKNFMIYNYCTDLKRYPYGLPPECKV